MKKRLVLVTAFLSSPLFAHTGHNHERWYADVAHAALGLSIAAAIGIAALITTRQKAKQESSL